MKNASGHLIPKDPLIARRRDGEPFKVHCKSYIAKDVLYDVYEVFDDEARKYALRVIDRLPGRDREGSDSEYYFPEFLRGFNKWLRLNHMNVFRAYASGSPEDQTDG